uniref:P63C domain-containing protein n=1 Tax=Candidatus Kentrum sp. TUN TaxID=2126343 RepID=A0A451AWP1_9GAMM|nr:MAG: P63C domain-containing protein [Candidatus Kentron sp. TUN]VFK64748.1 MAG: P63C domain-containing protein [Candidatus Kentron sp. TUN]VFK70464.1 MAG: P63C domain-containing protein [Candidatus Kentron sp. TUN]
MPRKPEKIIEPIDADFDDVTKALVTTSVESKIANEGFEKIIHIGELELGDAVVPCYVTETKKRLLSARRMQVALGVTNPTTKSGNQAPGTRLDRFLGQKSLKPLFFMISERTLLEPVRAKYGDQVITGYQAELLPELCEVMLHGRREGLLATERQKTIAAQCEVILPSLAKLGIIALVDEATGYLEAAEREKNEYRELFKEFIRKDAKQYESEFPDELYDVFYKIYGYERISKGRRPLFFAQVTKKYVYDPLAYSNGVILEMLDEKNPMEITVSGKKRRKYKLFQFLEDIGTSALRKHLWKLIGIGEAARNKQEFDRNFDRVFGKQILLPFPYPDEE